MELQKLADSTGETRHVDVLKTKKRVLADLLGVPTRGAVVCSRFQHVTMMDAPSHSFGLERKNGQRRLMHCLRSSDGQLLQDSAVSMQRASTKSCFDVNTRRNQKNCLSGLPKVSADANKHLEADISPEAWQRPGKAPGIDGLPADFYIAFWPVIGEDLLDVLRDSLLKGQLPMSCRRAVLTLLPKKGICRT